MLLTQLFSHVGSQNKPYLKLSVVLIRVTKLFTETRTWLLENKLKIQQGKNLLHLRYSAITISTPLCQSHYMYVHNSLHARQPCASCGSKPKRGEKDHFRHCSSPEVINCYLTTISGEISILTACSKICMSCYKFFNETTKQLAQAKSGNQISHETQRCQGFIRTRSKICLDQE